MVGKLTREQVSTRLEAIFSSSLEGDELAKALKSIDKRLDKFEGKWDGLIKWAEQKYGAPEVSEQGVPEKTEEENPEVVTQDQDAEQVDDVQENTGGISREEAASKMESIFRSHLEGEELDKMVGSIPKRLDKFEGKWPKLILWAEGKYGPADELSEQPVVITDDSQGPGPSRIEETLELIIKGDLEAALLNLKSMISEDPSSPDNWNAFSTYYSSIGFSGRAKACEEKAEALS